MRSDCSYRRCAIGGAPCDGPEQHGHLHERRVVPLLIVHLVELGMQAEEERNLLLLSARRRDRRSNLAAALEDEKAIERSFKRVTVLNIQINLRNGSSQS